MAMEDLEIRVTVDDDSMGGFERLEKRLKDLEAAANKINRVQAKAISDQAKLETQQSRERQERIRADTQLQTEQYRLQTAQVRQTAQAEANIRSKRETASRERLQAARTEAAQEAEARKIRLASFEEDRRQRRLAAQQTGRAHSEEVRHQRTLRREYDRTARARQRAFESRNIRDFFSKVADSVIAVEGVGYAFAGVASRVINAAAEFDRINRALVAITGNASRARAQISDIQELSRQPGITFQGAAGTSVRLRSAGFDQETTRRLIAEFANAAQISGAREEDAREALRQLTQIASTQRFTAENLNLILERLPIFRGVLQREFGTTVGGDLQKALEAQGLTFNDAIDRWLSGAERLQRVDADSFDNSLSNLSNDLNALAREIGSRLLPVAKQLVDGISSVVRFLSSGTGQSLLSVGTGALLGRGAQAAGTSLLSSRLVTTLLAALGGRSLGRSLGDLGSSRGIDIEEFIRRSERRSGGRRSFTERELLRGGSRSVRRAAGAGAGAAGRAAAGGAVRGAAGGLPGIAIGTAAGFAFDQYARYQERVEANTQRIQDQLERIHTSFNESVFGGDKGLAQLTTFDQNLSVVQGSLRDIVGELTGEPLTRVAETLRRALANLPDDAEELSRRLARTSSVINRHLSQSVADLDTLLENLDIANLSRARAVEITPQLEAAFTASQSTLDSAVARQEDYVKELARLDETIERLNQELVESAPREVRSGSLVRGFRTRTVFPEVEGVDDVEKYHNERRAQLEAARTERNTLDDNLERLKEQIALYRENNEVLRENIGLVKELRSFVDRTAPENRLARAATDLFSAERQLSQARTQEQVDAGLEAFLDANRKRREAEIASVTESEKNEELRRTKIRDINVRFDASDEDARQRAADLRSRISERAIREIDEIEKRIQEWRMEQDEIRESVKRLDAGINQFGENLRNFGNAATSIWRSLGDEIESAGRKAQDAISEFQAAQAAAIEVTTQEHEDRANAELYRRRTQEARRAGNRAEDALFGIGRPALTPLSETTREVVDPVTGDRIRAPLSREEERQGRISEERSDRRLRQGERVERFLSNTARSAYEQFGSDLLLDTLGIGGRSSDRLNDALEDLKSDYNRVREEIREDSTISEKARLDELRSLNEQYQKDVREIEMRSEQERQRAWRDWVKTVISDFGRLIFEQLELQLAAKATNAILGAFGGGGGVGLGAQQYASPIGPGIENAGLALAASGGGGGAAAGLAAAAPLIAPSLIGAAIAATAIVGLEDPLKDVFNSFSFHNQENDQYAFEKARQAGQTIFGGQTPSQFGRQSARDLVDNVAGGIAVSGGGGGGGSVVNNHITMRIGNREIDEMFTTAIGMANENLIATPGGSRVAQDVQEQRISNIEVSTEAATTRANDNASAARRMAETNELRINRLYQDAKNQIDISNPLDIGATR